MREPQPQKLKPRPCHAPSHASWLRGVYSNFNEHRENTERQSLYYDSGDIVAQRLALVRRGKSLHIYAWTRHSSGTIYVEKKKKERKKKKRKKKKRKIYVAFRDPGQLEAWSLCCEWSDWRFLFHEKQPWIRCKYMTYMTIMELSGAREGEFPTPSSPKMTTHWW